MQETQQRTIKKFYELMIEINIELEATVFTDYRTTKNFKITRELR
jgi:hypothetical protein